jgi:peptidoglycan/LPS O-acetylase OafA/YrhL
MRHGYPAIAFVLLLASVFPVLILFHLTRSHRSDRLIGELSYPVYLNHLIIIVAIRSIPALEPFSALHGVATGVLSVLSAWLFWHFFLSTFEARRHRALGLAPLPN